MNIILFGIYIVLSIVLTVIGLFIGNIILFDSILLAALSGLLCHTLWTLHPAFCLVVGIAVFLLLYWLQHTGVGFWLIGGMMSLLWSAVFGVLAYFISEHDPIWGWGGVRDRRCRAGRSAPTRKGKLCVIARYVTV